MTKRRETRPNITDLAEGGVGLLFVKTYLSFSGYFTKYPSIPFDILSLAFISYPFYARIQIFSIYPFWNFSYKATFQSNVNLWMDK